MKIIDQDSHVYRYRILRELSFALYWLASDEEHAYHEWLDMPIIDHRFFQAAALKFLQRKKTILLCTPSSKHICFVDEFLREIEEHDENVEKFLLWLASVSESIAERGSNGAGATLWLDNLGLWAHRKILWKNFERVGVPLWVADDYYESVHKYFMIGWNHSENIENKYLSGELPISEFDKLTYEMYFRELEDSPALFLSGDAQRALHFRWWARIRSEFSEEAMLRLHGLLESFLGADSMASGTGRLASIDDALATTYFLHLEK